MTASMFEQHTVLPPADPEDRARLQAMLVQLRDVLAPGDRESGSVPSQPSRTRPLGAPAVALLFGPDGRRVEVPGELFEVLLELAQAMAEDRAITVAPQSLTMTTQQAADFLGVSRPTLVKLLDRGEIPHERPGRHRRVRLPDLLAFQERRAAQRRAALDALTRDADELDLFDTPAPPARVRG